VIRVALAGDLDVALQQVPTSAGVGQILGTEDQSLVLGRAANLRRWAARQLGRAKLARKGGRPPTDLSPIAGAIGFVETTSEFHQRLSYERLIAPLVPIEKRRDLKRPVWLHLDVDERFPRITLVSGAAERGALFGPFRDRRSAEKAVAALHKLHPLRPCDFVFEPDPALALGLGCLYAQVKTCAAPCLVRVTEEAYTYLAHEAARLLGEAAGRGEDVAAWLPPWVTALEDSRALVVEKGRYGIEVYPVREGAVLEEGRAVAADLASARAVVRWPTLDAPRDDTAWLTAWLSAPKRKGAYVIS
jgi:hypothetical protein